MSQLARFHLQSASREIRDGSICTLILIHSRTLAPGSNYSNHHVTWSRSSLTHPKAQLLSRSYQVDNQHSQSHHLFLNFFSASVYISCISYCRCDRLPDRNKRPRSCLRWCSPPWRESISVGAAWSYGGPTWESGFYSITWSWSRGDLGPGLMMAYNNSKAYLSTGNVQQAEPTSSRFHKLAK